MGVFLKDSESNVIVGSGSWDYLVLEAGYYSISMKCSITDPQLATLTFGINDVTVDTITNSGINQAHVELLATNIRCELNDVLDFGIAGSIASDPPNSLITLITIAAETFQ